MTLESFFENFGGDLSEISLLSFSIAFLAGIVSSGVCPCTLPVGLGIAGLSGSHSEKQVPVKEAPQQLEYLSMAFAKDQGSHNLLISWDNKYIAVPFEPVD